MDRKPDETLYAFIERRENELVHQIAALRGEIESREHELVHLRSAKRQMGGLGGNDKERLGVPSYAVGLGLHAPNELGPPPVGLGLGIRTLVTYNEMTIQQLVLRALSDQFHEGATPAQLRSFIKDAYGREIDRASIAPQLARLKNNGLVKAFQVGDKLIWRKTKELPIPVQPGKSIP